MENCLGNLFKETVQFLERETVVRPDRAGECSLNTVKPISAYNPARVEPGGIGDSGWLIDKGFDVLVVTGASSQAGEQLLISYRFILRGTVSIVVADSQVLDLSAGDRSVRLVSYKFKGNPLFEGVVGNPDIYLTDVSIQATKATTRGQSFARVNLVRQSQGPNAAIAPIKCALMSDYVTQQVSACLRNARHFTSIEGQGWVHTVIGNAVPVGTSFIEQVPANARWKLNSLLVSFSTSGVASDRLIRFLFDDGNNITNFCVQSLVSQTATQAVAYTLAPCGYSVGPSAFICTLGSPIDFVLLAGHRILSQTLNIDAGDQYSQPHYVVEEWLDNV